MLLEMKICTYIRLVFLELTFEIIPWNSMACHWISFCCFLCFPHQDHIQWKWHQTLMPETLASRTCPHRKSPGTWFHPFRGSSWACQWLSLASGSSSSCSHGCSQFHKLFHAHNPPDLAYLNNLSWKSLFDHFRFQDPEIKMVFIFAIWRCILTYTPFSKSL